ncbi:PhzF family phenazine biosynthesis protein [Roseococcus sp. DSY-14]|uniref:PhzF family phenazine biosynthesis protein n=1 Tax=Roseococcus sp. DSY-14 TaxID=3369650 RepID=UPI00387AD14F
MRRFRFLTLDVFTGQRFGGNPLAVFPEAEGLADAEMQALAAELNLSETTFVLPPADPANDARVRIFNRTAEMPFAGHPNVGTAWALRHRARGGVLRFEELAGLVTVRLEDAAATVEAPQPLALGPEMPAELLAPCLGVAPLGKPVLASCGNSFVLAEVAAEDLPRAAPDLAAFRAAAAAWPHAAQGGAAPRLPVHLWARSGAAAIRARMFSPLSGTLEDAATGSAATPLAALLHARGEGSAFAITQGVEMRRPSLLHARAWDAADGVRASVGGGCVPVLEGWAAL